jgi:hypothetical protein
MMLKSHWEGGAWQQEVLAGQTLRMALGSDSVADARCARQPDRNMLKLEMC